MILLSLQYYRVESSFSITRCRCRWKLFLGVTTHQIHCCQQSTSTTRNRARVTLWSERAAGGWESAGRSADQSRVRSDG